MATTADAAEHATRLRALAAQCASISIDEFHRAKDSDVNYMHNRHPMIDMDWSRDDCLCYLASIGMDGTPKSACLGCPFHGNAQWRRIRETSPAEWQDVVEFDAAIRGGNARANAAGNPLLGQAFLHRSRTPWIVAPIDHVTAAERAALSIGGGEADQLDNGVEDGCSPWACRGDVEELTQSDFGPAA
jgi:hypothetical protein